MYRVALVLVIAMASTISYANAAGPNYLDYDSLTAQQRMVLGIYVIGASEAYGWANVSLVQRGDAPLFCVPANLHINGNRYLEIFKAESANHRSAYKQMVDRSGHKSMDFVDIVLLDGLKSTFPCGK